LFQRDCARASTQSSVNFPANYPANYPPIIRQLSANYPEEELEPITEKEPLDLPHSDLLRLSYFLR
jgi:hypothetical protein